MSLRHRRVWEAPVRSSVYLPRVCCYLWLFAPPAKLANAETPSSVAHKRAAPPLFAMPDYHTSRSGLQRTAAELAAGASVNARICPCPMRTSARCSVPPRSNNSRLAHSVCTRDIYGSARYGNTSALRAHRTYTDPFVRERRCPRSIARECTNAESGCPNAPTPRRQVSGARATKSHAR